MISKAEKVDTTDMKILDLIRDTRLQQTLILHLEGKSAKEISEEVGAAAKQALSLLSEGRGKLNQVNHEILFNAVQTHMDNGLSMNLAIANVSEEFTLSYLTVSKAYKKYAKGE